MLRRAVRVGARTRPVPAPMATRALKRLAGSGTAPELEPESNVAVNTKSSPVKEPHDCVVNAPKLSLLLENTKLPPA